MSEITKTLLPADLAYLEQAQNFVHQQAQNEALNGKLSLVFEELFVNVTNYAYPDADGQVEIVCIHDVDTQNGRKVFKLCVRDWGECFNPLEKEPPTLSDELDDRPIGGLGIFFVTQMADECKYTRHDNCNEFQAIFYADESVKI